MQLSDIASAREVVVFVRAYGVSHHAGARLNQRGFDRQDIELVVELGESVDDGYLMTRMALRCAKSFLKEEGRLADLQRVDHLHNVAVIELGGQLVTIYRADKRRIRRLRAGHVISENRKLQSDVNEKATHFDGLALSYQGAF